MDNSEKCDNYNWRDFGLVSDAILHAFRKVLQERSSFECDTIRGNLENPLRLEINILYKIE